MHGHSIQPMTPEYHHQVHQNMDGAVTIQDSGSLMLSGQFCTVQPSPRAVPPSLMTEKYDGGHAEGAHVGHGAALPLPTLDALNEAILAPKGHAGETANQIPASHSVLYPVAYNISHESSPSSPGGAEGGDPPTSTSFTLRKGENSMAAGESANDRTVVSGALLKLSRPGCCCSRRWLRRFFIIKGRSLQYYHGNFASGVPRKCWDISFCTYVNVGTYQRQNNAFEIQVEGQSLILSACKSSVQVHEFIVYKRQCSADS